jgi:hypothetical protein
LSGSGLHHLRLDLHIELDTLLAVLLEGFCFGQEFNVPRESSPQSAPLIEEGSTTQGKVEVNSRLRKV